MTEEEAKTKWCPYRKGQFPNETYCITSDCMAWAKEYKKLYHADGTSGFDRVEVGGYCGLVK